MLLDLTGAPMNVGDFIIYCTKTEAPGLQFGYIEQIKSPVSTGQTTTRRWTYKVRHADFRGTVLNKTTWDSQQRQYVDTDKPSTAWLTVPGNWQDPTADPSDYRAMVTKP